MGTNRKMVEDFKKSMTKEFEMTDLGLMKYFLGFQVQQFIAPEILTAII